MRDRMASQREQFKRANGFAVEGNLTSPKGIVAE
jgi:hypothetical protein